MKRPPLPGLVPSLPIDRAPPWAARTLQLRALAVLLLLLIAVTIAGVMLGHQDVGSAMLGAMPLSIGCSVGLAVGSTLAERLVASRTRAAATALTVALVLPCWLLGLGLAVLLDALHQGPAQATLAISHAVTASPVLIAIFALLGLTFCWAGLLRTGHLRWLPGLGWTAAAIVVAVAAVVLAGTGRVAGLVPALLLLQVGLLHATLAVWRGVDLLVSPASVEGPGDSDLALLTATDRLLVTQGGQLVSAMAAILLVFGIGMAAGPLVGAAVFATWLLAIGLLSGNHAALLLRRGLPERALAVLRVQRHTTATTASGVVVAKSREIQGLLQLGRTDEVEAGIGELLTLLEDGPRGLSAMGQRVHLAAKLLEQDRHDLALPLVEQPDERAWPASLRPNRAANLGAALIHAGREEEALVLLSLERIGRARGMAKVILANNRAVALINAGRDADQAVRLARDAVQARPASIVLGGTLGAALVASGGDPAQARPLLEAALAREGGSARRRAWLQLYLGRALLALGEDAAAREHLDAAIQHGEPRIREQARALISPARS